MFLLPLSELFGRPDSIRGGCRMKSSASIRHARGWQSPATPAASRCASLDRPRRGRPPAPLGAAPDGGRGMRSTRSAAGTRSSGSPSAWARGPSRACGSGSRRRGRWRRRDRCPSPAVGSLDALAAGIAELAEPAGPPRARRCSTPAGARPSRRSAARTARRSGPPFVAEPGGARRALAGAGRNPAGGRGRRATISGPTGGRRRRRRRPRRSGPPGRGAAHLRAGRGSGRGGAGVGRAGLSESTRRGAMA